MTAKQPLKRRELLQRLVDRARDATSNVRAQACPPQRRPPGALPEAAFLSSCTRCGKCGQACPERAIFVFGQSTGALASTPVLLPERRPCLMCEGYPCAAACEDGALVPPPAPLVRLGEVSIVTERCLAYRGPECGACIGVCPDGVQALRLVAWKPVVEDGCVGCGLCIRACPTDPKAIVLQPL